MEVIARADGRDDEAFYVDLDAPVATLARDIADRLQLAVSPEDVELYVDGRDECLPHDVALQELDCGPPNSVTVHIPAAVRAKAALMARSITDPLPAFDTAIAAHDTPVLHDLCTVADRERRELFAKIICDIKTMTDSSLRALLDARPPLSIRAHAVQWLITVTSDTVPPRLSAEDHLSTEELRDAYGDTARVHAHLNAITRSPHVPALLARRVVSPDALFTLLAVASRHCGPECVEALAAHGATFAKHDGRHPLAMAVEHGSVDAVDALLARPEVVAEINTPSVPWYGGGKSCSRVQNTALYYACGVSPNAREHLVTALLAAGADVNAEGTGGPPLLRAADIGDGGTVEQLLAAGADPRAVDGCGANLLHAVAPHRDVVAGIMGRLREVLAGGIDVNGKLANGCTPLTAAAADANADLVSLLLEHGADASAATNDGATALYLAVQIRGGAAAQVCERMVAADASLLDRPHTSGRTPLIAAAEAGRTGIVRLLLQLGADPCLADRQGSTALHAAVGVNNMVAYRSCSAFERDRLEIIKELLKAGADRRAAAGDGQTPYDLAVEAKMTEDMCSVLRVEKETRKPRFCTLQ